MADGRLVMFPIVAVIVAGAARSLPTAPAPTASPKVDLASVAQGGLLYDEWWKVVPEASEAAAPLIYPRPL